MRHLLLTFLLSATVAVAAESVDAAPTLCQGTAAMARQDYAAAVAILSPLAQNGDPAAQAYLGYLYTMGRGVPQDFTQAAI
ncbi:MAG TPA: hypothetical protein VK591_03540 [Xanthobacteraceae bacterium]|nr:hypothetical protein [Xanthobacteraceae bacterium]